MTISNIQDKKILHDIRDVLIDDGEPQDSIGNTRLTLLADRIKLSRNNKHDRALYVQAIKEAAIQLPKYSVREVENLCTIVYLAELRKDEFRDTFLDIFNKWEPTRDKLEQRAIVYRLIGEFGEDLELSYLQKGDEIRKEYPWYWIDVAMYMHREEALNTVKEWLKVNKDITPIIERLSHWWDLFKNKEEYYGMVSELIKGVASEKEIEVVRSFFESFGIPESIINKIIGSQRSADKINNQFLENAVSVERRRYQPVCPATHCIL